jgi:4-hydroxybenzoate polyprenyltransferase
LCGGDNFSPQLFLAAWAWAMAMHAYSAVPDISADREANVPTVATRLGLRATIVFCWTLYILSALLAFFALGWFAIALGVVYSVLMFRSIRAGSEAGVMEIYRGFPLINTLVGGALWWFVACRNPRLAVLIKARKRSRGGFNFPFALNFAPTHLEFAV